MPTGIYERKSYYKTGKRERSPEEKEILKKRFQEQAALKKGKKRLPFSEEWKRKMSESRKGKDPWNKGKSGIYSEEYLEKIKIGRKKQVITEEQRKKQSLTMKNKVSEGKCHLWKGGICPVNLALRKSLEYKFWRQKVFKRDNFTCVLCGNNKSGNLEADHIKPFSTFPDLRFEIDNGRTLCKECHRKTETYGNHKIRERNNHGQSN